MPSKRTFRSKKNWWLPFRAKMLFLVFLGLFFVISPQKERHGVVIALSDFYPINREPLPIPTPAPYPVNLTNTQPPEGITAYGIDIVDLQSGVTLYKKNESEALAPASTTKIMTALVALEQYKLTDIVTIKAATVEGQLMDLIPGERMTVENLLYGLLIESGNDAAAALADFHPQGYQAFMDLMNQKAQDLHLEQTHFVNPIGLDDQKQTMSAHDLARLSRFAMQDPVFTKIVGIPDITIADVDFQHFHNLKNINQLLGKIPGVAGIKTGWTQNAGENLVTLVERNGHKIILVTLRSRDRFGDTTKLIDWVFANHQWMNYGI